MNLDQWMDVIAIVFGAGGIVSVILSIRRTRAQNTLDLSSAWEKFAAPLMERLTFLENHTHEQDKEIIKLNEKVTDQEAEIEDLRGYVARLVKQLIDAGIEPVQFIRRKKQVKE